MPCMLSEKQLDIGDVIRLLENVDQYNHVNVPPIKPKAKEVYLFVPTFEEEQGMLVLYFDTSGTTVGNCILMTIKRFYSLDHFDSDLLHALFIECISHMSKHVRSFHLLILRLPLLFKFFLIS